MRAKSTTAAPHTLPAICLWLAVAAAAFLAPFAAHAEPTARAKQVVHYRSGWQRPHLHVKGTSGWTAVPGQGMRSGPGGWWRAQTRTGVKAFLFNDGARSWDHAPGGGTYRGRSGLAEYWVERGRVTHAPPGKGRVERHSFRSSSLGRARKFFVYLPAGYEAHPDKRYPVLYLQDGQNLLGSGGWDVARAIERETQAGRAGQAIIVGIDNSGGGRIDDYSPSVDREVGQGGGADRYLRFVADELKPWVDRSFRTKGDKANTAIGGSSLGGLVALHGGLSRGETFGRVLAMSPSLWWNEREVVKRFEGLARAPTTRIYIDSGGGGRAQDGKQHTFALRDALSRKGMRFGANLFHWYQAEHGHNERAWRDRFPRAFATLFPPERATD